MIRVQLRTTDLVTPALALVPDAADMRLLGSDAILQINNRTQAGRDVDNNEFQPYSAGYAKYKQKRGASTNVTLMDTGRMRNSMSTKPLENGVQIYFADAERRLVAAWHHYGEGQPERKFFGLSDAELADLTRKLITRIRRRAR